jgi:Holliday junction resolvase RusA-like endonuclease
VGFDPNSEWVRQARERGLIPADGPPPPAPGTAFYAELAVPPSVNHLFVTRGRRRFKSPAYRAWLAAAVPAARLLRPPRELPCRVTVDVIGKLRANRDIDNLLKPIGDCLVAAGVLPTDDVRTVRGWTVTYKPAARPAVVLVGTQDLGWG